MYYNLIMEKEKLTFLKEKELQKKAKENYKRFLENTNAQFPIKAKFFAFQKTKKEIDLKDLF